MDKETERERWNEVMKLAEKYGFITMSSGGVSILMDYDNQREQGIFARTQKMNGVKEDQQ